MNEPFEDISDWIGYGIDRGWVTPACATHDGIPSNFDEDEEFDQGLDPCQPVLRVWFP